MEDRQVAPLQEDEIQMRLRHLENGYIDLLERVMVLERGLRFELSERAALEGLSKNLIGLPGRVDRLEVGLRNLRQRRLGAGEGDG